MEEMEKTWERMPQCDTLHQRVLLEPWLRHFDLDSVLRVPADLWFIVVAFRMGDSPADFPLRSGGRL